MCKTCHVKNKERHILSWCKECNYDLVQRHGIVVDEIYMRRSLNNGLNGNYEHSRKFIQFTKGFLEKEK